jgi:hypothetical protein
MIHMLCLCKLSTGLSQPMSLYLVRLYTLTSRRCVSLLDILEEV